MLDVLAQRRLADPEPNGGAAKMQFFGDGDEGPHEAQLNHSDALLISIQIVLDGMVGAHHVAVDRRTP
ncbi:hypothetical protein [Methylocystis sp. SC2]|uniref:hypothetical protein n=1 Tax=Methylocystis sp. (strain SC2) TaxID=187303 RepID=UPI001FCC1C49|nr:hypothetical protein [Methylocystis sp. SC2]